MKVFCIYTPSDPRTLEIAESCVDSFKKHRGWKPELFAGCDPTTLEEYEAKYNISDRRAKYTNIHQKYAAKKSCFYSHYALWNKCVELQKPICVVEYDVRCISKYPVKLAFDGVMHLAIESSLRARPYQRLWPNDHDQLLRAGKGIFPVNFSQRRDGYPCIPGNVAYGISPDAALTLIKECETHGWIQNDVLMTAALIPVKYIMPPLIEYDEQQELHTSHVRDRLKEVNTP